jgi:LysM repeat protein
MSSGWPALAQDPPPPPPTEDSAVVRFGDTVLKIAQRYGLTIQELLSLNPGLETGRLVVGSQVRLAQPLRPGPTALPSRAPSRFEASLAALVRDGLVSPEERARIRSGSDMSPVNEPAHQQACSSGALSQQECSSDLVVRWQGKTIDASEPTTKPLSTNELALLQRIRADSSSPRWRVYGQCKYDWAGWKLHSNGTRTTAADCGGTAMRWTVGVSCHHLLIATKATASSWSKWARPAGPENKSRQGEDEMVAALCANAP